MGPHEGNEFVSLGFPFANNGISIRPLVQQSGGRRMNALYNNNEERYYISEIR